MEGSFDLIGICIVNYNNYIEVINYLNISILKQKCVDFKVVIVDNNSHDNSYEYLLENYKNHNNVYIIQNASNKGYGHGNNLGINFLKKNGCNYIIISNSDLFIEDDYLLIKLFNNFIKLDKAGLISPLMFKEDNTINHYTAWRSISFLQDLFEFTYLTGLFASIFFRTKFYNFKNSGIKKVDCVNGAFFFTSYDVLSKISFFDEDTFLYNEEAILAYKCLRSNYINYIIQDVNFIHYQSTTINRLLSEVKKYSYLKKSKIIFWGKYRNKRLLATILFNILFIYLKFELYLKSLFKK
jgi:GT2 family glycosyltransferase